MAKAKLKYALDRQRGVDNALQHQKKLQKAAEKRRRSKTQPDLADQSEDDEEDDLTGEEDGEDVMGDAIAFDESGNVQNGDLEEGEDEWLETDEDEEEAEEGDLEGFDLSRLQDSDSDSDSADENGAMQKHSTDVAQTSLNGPSVPTTALKSALNNDTPNADNNDEEDIPLSDISSVGSAEADLIPHQRLTINNTAALQRALMSIALPTSDLPFSEHMSITSSAPVVIEDIEDEFKREVALYEQALNAVREARSQLKKEGVPFSRPNDYFAEMVKSDEHMGRIKKRLVDQAASERASKDAKRQRDLKKFGKKAQIEVLKERAKAKKDMLEKVSSLKRKRQGAALDTTNEDDLFDVALEDAATSERKDREARRKRGGQGEPNRKRQKKDERFGFGGKKKYSKSNDAASSSDVRGISKRTKGGPGRAGGVNKAKGKVGASKRLGKSRRAKQR